MDTLDTLDTPTASRGGNTSPSGPPRCATKLRNWFLTWNNYTEEDKEEFRQWVLDSKTKTHAIQAEVGENGTPHLQGCIAFENGRSFDQLHKKWPKVHWERCKSLKDAMDYCQKSETRVEVIDVKDDKPEEIEDELSKVEPYWWQRNIIDLVKEKPDNRTIHWYFDEVGNGGKTTLAKHLCINYPDQIIMLSGGPSNCKYGIMSFLYNKVKGEWVRNNRNLRAVLFDFTRSQDDKVSYQALEEIKNGIFFNTKYECKQILYNCPHVICFANFIPDTKKLSEDRWKIIDINSDVV